MPEMWPLQLSCCWGARLPQVRALAAAGSSGASSTGHAVLADRQRAGTHGAQPWHWLQDASHAVVTEPTQAARLSWLLGACAQHQPLCSNPEPYALRVIKRPPPCALQG